MAEKKQAHFEIVAERLIEEMKKGTSIFQKPWQDIAPIMPYNPLTKKEYRGMNSLWLFMQGREDPRWMTFKQAADEGYKIKKGEKGSQITFFSYQKESYKKDEKGKYVLDENGDKIKIRTRLDKPIISSAYVFNAEQIDGIPSLKQNILKQEWENKNEVENLIKNLNVDLRFGGNQAFYSPSKDIIVMPNKSQFRDERQYYSILFHEIGHWTGHKERLDRLTNDKFGSEGYAKEELRAEIASLMLGGKYGVGRDFTQHASYINSWIKVLQNDPFELYKSASDAQSIVDYVIKFEEKQDLIIEQKSEIYDDKKVKYIEDKIEKLGFNLNREEKESLEREIFEGTPLINLSHSEEKINFDFKIKNTESKINIESIEVTNLENSNKQSFIPSQNFSKTQMKDLIQGKKIEAYIKSDIGIQGYQISFDFEQKDNEGNNKLLVENQPNIKQSL